MGHALIGNAFVAARGAKVAGYACWGSGLVPAAIGQAATGRIQWEYHSSQD